MPMPAMPASSLPSCATASGKAVPYAAKPRHAGDLAGMYSNPDAARLVLGWQATRDLQVMCADTWRRQSANPLGYVGGHTQHDTLGG